MGHEQSHGRRWSVWQSIVAHWAGSLATCSKEAVTVLAPAHPSGVHRARWLWVHNGRHGAGLCWQQWPCLMALAGWSAGDLAKPQLGLSDDKWAQLAKSVDTIVHNGALVNHAFTYEQLFEPNVLGSVEVGATGLRLHATADALLCYAPQDCHSLGGHLMAPRGPAGVCCTSLLRSAWLRPAVVPCCRRGHGSVLLHNISPHALHSAVVRCCRAVVVTHVVHAYLRQVMRLALQQRRKAIAFVSSVGILAGIEHPQPVRESEEALDLATQHLGDGGYAMGCVSVGRSHPFLGRHMHGGMPSSEVIMSAWWLHINLCCFRSVKAC